MELAEAGFRRVTETSDILCNSCNLQLKVEPSAYFDPLAVHQMYAGGVCSFLKDKLSLLNEDHAGDNSGEQGRIQEEPVPVDGAEGGTGLLTMTNTNGISGEASPTGQPKEDREKYLNFTTINKSKRIRETLIPLHIEHDAADMRYEIARKKTFSGAKKDLTDYLASQGLYEKYTITGKQLHCAFCEYRSPIFDNFSTNEIFLNHQRCSFVMKGIGRQAQNHNVPDIHDKHCWNSTGKRDISGFTGLGINYQLAKHPEMAPADRRQQTFLTYPLQTSHSADVSQLCSAGYFYEGNADSVTCFWCDCKSANWKPREDPLVRHARTNASCPFLLQKGRDFASSMVAEHGVYREPEPRNVINTITTRMLRPRWDTSVVQRAIQIGLRKDKLKTVVSDRIKKGEPDFRYLSEIVKAVCDLKVPRPRLSAADALTLPTLVQAPSRLSKSEEEEDEEQVIEALQCTHKQMEVDNDSENMPEEEPQRPEPTISVGSSCQVTIDLQDLPN